MDFKDLTPELKEKAARCKTPDELLALAKSEGFELSDDEIKDISGGVDWSCNDQDCSSYLVHTHN